MVTMNSFRLLPKKKKKRKRKKKKNSVGRLFYRYPSRRLPVEAP
jgi:hypothetical protein